MKQFMFIYRSPAERPDASPEDMQQVMQAWMDWIGQAMSEGWMTNPGDALLPDSGNVVTKSAVQNGPFIESKELVGGFSLIQADDLDTATKLTAGCPSLSYGGSVEVRELMNVSQN